MSHYPLLRTLASHTHVLGDSLAESRDPHALAESRDTFAQRLMSAPDFLAYIDKHGHHFTPTLADTVTHQLKNADGTTHHWTTAQVKTALEAAGMKDNPHNMTWGDAAFLANWFYSDEFPDYLKTETDVIKRTYKAAQDPDGYEGMTFARWLADVVMCQWHIDWAAYM